MTPENPTLIRTVEAAFGIKGRFKRLPGELDLNFVIETGQDRRVFKLMRAGCDPQIVDLQINAMQYIANNGFEQLVPSVLQTKNGERWINFPDDQGNDRIGWMLSFLPGKMMAETTPWSPGLAASIGEVLARVDKALEDFDHPMLDRVLKWDLRQAHWIGDHVKKISGEKNRALIEKITQRFVHDVSPRLDALPRTPIHGDANDMNVFVQATKTGAQSVTGLIDFGDMARAPRICEPAVAMAYAMMGEGDWLARGAALIGAYNKVSSLHDYEVSLLAPLVKLRLAVSVTNAAIERVEHPDNDYLTISEAPAWALLEKLEAMDEASIAENFDPTRSSSKHHHSAKQASSTSLIARRGAVIPGNQVLSYDQPLHFVRGEKHFLFDAEGDQYLDAYNNVPHIGHANAHVVAAVRRQMALLNTNTRYLQDIHLAYAERMIGLLPKALSKIVFLNSASEANELALRLARTFTGAKDMLVMDHGYHGGTTGAMDISPYKFHHPKGAGAAPDWVHIAPQPNVYSGLYREADAPERYLADAAQILKELSNNNRPLAGFISECVPSVGGQVVLPDGYLKAIYKMVRAAGGVCIADDVQTALGRLGDFFWGFDQQMVAPDIVVFGKPLGNGFPLAAVAMTEEIADAFASGPEYFSTFGGSSAACAAGDAVLDVLEGDQLQENAHAIGEVFLSGLSALAAEFDIIGEVRGFGLFLGVDLVTDQKTRAPATPQASYIKNRMREERILIGVEGPADNVLKIRPPMTFDETAADQLLSTLKKVLNEDPAQPG